MNTEDGYGRTPDLIRIIKIEDIPSERAVRVIGMGAEHNGIDVRITGHEGELICQFRDYKNRDLFEEKVISFFTSGKAKTYPLPDPQDGPE